MKTLIGLILSCTISLIAYNKESLSKSGSMAAVILGTGIVFFGGYIPFALMMVFFISSSVLSKIGKKKKEGLEKIHEKGDARDYIQVMANGGVALIFLAIFYFAKDLRFFIAVAVSFASSNSDTWASEVGVLSTGRTISIITGKPIKNGVSGGVSKLGTISAFLGSSLIGVIYMIFHYIYIDSNNILKICITISILGFLGSIIDSILGATIQGQYIDEFSGRITEKRFNDHGENKLVKGYYLINNDVVNILSNLLVTLVSLFII